MQRINLLLISEAVEMVSEDTDDDEEGKLMQKETKHHYCWIKNLNRLLYDQNKYKCKTYLCDRCLHGLTKEGLVIKHTEDCYGINKN